MTANTIEIELPADKAEWIGQRLISDTWNKYRNGEPHEQAIYTLADPCGEAFCYWCAVGGKCFALDGGSSSCIASVESAIREAHLPRVGREAVYVIWQPKDHKRANWRRWTDKWTKRTVGN